MSDQSVGPKTPAPRREVWDHVQWGITQCGMPVPQGIEFLNEGDELNPLIVCVKVSSADDAFTWSLYLGLRGHETNTQGVFHYGEVLGWKWHVDWYRSFNRSAEVVHIAQTAEVARIPQTAEVEPLAYLVVERRDGELCLGDDWTSQVGDGHEALAVAERWKADGTHDAVAVALIEVKPQ